MAKFKYIARDPTGKLVKEVVAGTDPIKLREELEKKGYKVLKVEAVSSKGAGGLFAQKVKESDLALFSRQLGALISAGVGLAEALDILGEQLPNKTLQSALKSVKEDVAAGMPFHKALAKHSKVFPPFFVNLMEAAEESGNMDIMLERATQYYEKIAMIKRKVKSASWYPIMVVVISTIIVTGILAFIVPSFAQLYSSMGADLPGLTQMLIDASNALKNNLIEIIAFFILAFAGIKFLYSTAVGKRLFHTLFLKMPLLGPIFLKGALAKFGRTLSTLVAGGVPIIRALEIAGAVAGNVVIEGALKEAKVLVEQGKPLFEALDPKIFPSIFIAMVKVGENTGKMDEMLDTIANFYEDEVDRAVEGLIQTIEPMLMVFIGTIIAVILAGLYLPIFNLGNVVGGG
jgi:type IV pilus assembly protein PilC